MGHCVYPSYTHLNPDSCTTDFNNRIRRIDDVVKRLLQSLTLFGSMAPVVASQIKIDKCIVTRYIVGMIRTFKNRAIKKLYEKGDPSKIKSDHVERVEDILFRLDNAVKTSDMDWPGFNLHRLKGKHKGFWAVWVSGNYRIWYRFENGDAFDVDYGDYH